MNGHVVLGADQRRPLADQGRPLVRTGFFTLPKNGERNVLMARNSFLLSSMAHTFRKKWDKNQGKTEERVRLLPS
jgi:hypothetical protein